jgi:hypothetical protein
MSRSLVAVGLLAVAALFFWSRPADTAAPGPKVEDPPQVKLAKRVKFDGFEDPRMTLGEALNTLAEKYDLTFEVNESAFDGMPDVLKTAVIGERPIPKMTNVRVEKILRTVLARIPGPPAATYTFRNDAIEITTVEVQQAEIWGNYTGPFLPLTNGRFTKTPLEDVLKELSAQTDFTILLDARAAEQGKTPVSARLANTPLDTAVRLLADMADLQSVHLDNVLYVTTKAKAEALEAQLTKEQPKEKPCSIGGVDAPAWRKGGDVHRALRPGGM